MTAKDWAVEKFGRSRRPARRVAAVCALLLLASCGGDDDEPDAAETDATESDAAEAGDAEVLWAAPPNAMELTEEAGLTPERSEFLEYHVHAHLDMFLDGKPITVPGGIGIDITSPTIVGDEASGYGLAGSVCDEVCISPLHTHGPDGVLHTETATPAPNNLGQFFTEWDVRLDEKCVGDYCDDVTIYVDGEAYDGDPREIELSDRREIAIVIGTAPDSIPSEFPS